MNTKNEILTKTRNKMFEQVKQEEVFWGKMIKEYEKDKKKRRI